MQSHFMPAKLIKMRLRTRFEEPIDSRVEAIGAFVNDKGGMPKGWKGQKLPMISENPVENHEQNGSKQPSLASPLGSTGSLLALHSMLLRFVNCLKWCSISKSTTAVTPLVQPPVTAPASNPENVPVLPSSGSVQAASEQPTELSEEQIISNCTIAYQLGMAVSKQVAFRKRFKTFQNSKMLLRSRTFRNNRYPVEA